MKEEKENKTDNPKKNTKKAVTVLQSGLDRRAQECIALFLKKNKH